MRASEFIPAYEGWPCMAGSGECSRPAIISHDDGSGGDFMLCEKHQVEWAAVDAVFSKLNIDELLEVSALIDAAE